MKLNKRQAFFAVIVVLLVLGFLELTLGLLAFVSPRVDRLLTAPWIPPVVLDARLGHRPIPTHPGHDRKGFRNLEVPAKAHIVALGDSQTYGTGVEREDAWPKQLEALTGKTVYSMAYGGYGPAHSLVLWDEAMALSPHIVIEAFYAGNDLFEAFDLVYNQQQFPELKNADPQVQARIREAEQSAPLATRVVHLFNMGTLPLTLDDLSPWKFLLHHSKLYGLLRRARYESAHLVPPPTPTPQAQWDMAKAFAETHSAYCQVFRHGPFKTVFTSEYRLVALDLGDPRIAEGLQISLRVIQRMHAFAAARNIWFLVVLIPTKEAVFRQLWQNPSRSYRSLRANEERVWRMTQDFLDHHGIGYLDSLPVLQAQLATGIQPYQVSHDGHPNEHGHQAIAQLVAAHLASSKTWQAPAVQDAAADADKPRR